MPFAWSVRSVVTGLVSLTVLMRCFIYADPVVSL